MTQEAVKIDQNPRKRIEIVMAGRVDTKASTGLQIYLSVENGNLTSHPIAPTKFPKELSAHRSSVIFLEILENCDIDPSRGGYRFPVTSEPSMDFDGY